MNAIPVDAHPYVLAAAIMAVLLVSALVRVWLLRRLEAKLLKNIQELESQIAIQEREVVTIRQDAAAWRTEMQRQFDAHRATMSEQVAQERKRFDDLLAKSRQREYEQQTALDLAKQMCAELPAAKARVMQLEQALDIDGGEGLVFDEHGAVSPMPDLTGDERTPPNGSDVAPSELPEIPSEDIVRVQELEEKIGRIQQHNSTLQQALAATRVRSRLQARSAARPNPSPSSLK